MIQLSKVSKQFRTGVFALSDISFEVEKGEFVFLVGPTGSGKTTIFRLLTREALPTTGEVIVDNWDVVKLPNNKISHLRKKIGVVFQDLKLLMDRTIFENIILPLEVSGIDTLPAAKIVEDVMGKVGILSHRDKFPIQLSGGELQRAAIARALILEPDILLADEPTGNLDSQTAMEIVRLLENINKKGTTVIMATHNEDAIKTLSKRIIALDKGQLAGESGKKSKTHTEHSEKKSAIIKKEENPSTSSGLRKEDEEF
ncbi:MAG: cell division ATP-binding protein FtsE [Candidatus Levybacteria bacterium RIFCSPLOWO2_01_FULL_39_24]|nr:MAG: cell division ATP-binding protein FtsE [Candidatus Levybacteria bacterium RIFCSPHIGHO2_01_FULL_40_16]OGH28613.1 MAG: cell division ATP-binding protein FtsE [Candidatus Levybacteria bacterium RIFCSPHIGHO2_12_FULL_39_9]OGH46002.1 MAG: cell division ATP-binding protein FtsE [Candidatus Levybacteria bacterium RIFCSPLOWO2_01_FULL_39_24]